MTDDRTIEEIRAQKREALQRDIQDGDSKPTPVDPIHIESTEEFETVTNTYDVVLVDFYADWCGPCQMMEPVIDGIATETSAAVAKVDVDHHQQLAANHGVQGVPTLILFTDGDPVEQLVGIQQYDELESLIQRYKT